MDLSKFKTDAPEGAEMIVLEPGRNVPLGHDEGQPPAKIRLLGVDSDAYQKATRANLNKRLAAARGNRTAGRISAEEMEAEQLEVLVACTIAWENIEDGPEHLDCTPANARRVYAKFPWLREQATQFVEDRTNFLKS